MIGADIRRLAPGWIFTPLRGYRVGWLPGDLVAGPMLAAIAIPGQLATARLAGLIGAFAVDSSPPSTAIVHESGGRSQIASLTAVALMVALAVLAGQLTAYLPHAALSCILVYIALRIFRVGEMIQIHLLL